MRLRSSYVWGQLRASYWFIPIAMSLAAIILALVLGEIDDATRIDHLPGLSSIDPPGSRTLLSTIAGATITVAAVVFSITMVVLSTVSNQFGPRLLPNFMKHNSTQLVLGVFIGTFVYCLLVLTRVHDQSLPEEVPHISVGIGLSLGILSFMLLIYFIHRVSQFIQAQNIINDVASDLMRALAREFPPKLKTDIPTSPSHGNHSLESISRQSGREILAERDGYIQAIDMRDLRALAAESDSIVRLLHRPGQFIFAGSALALALPKETITDEIASDIRGAIMIGAQRTSIQDPAYAVEQLVEVAVRALSPGIGHPFTAISCIDRLGAALAFLAERDLPSPFLADDAGHVRVIAVRQTYDDLVDTAFNQIRQRGVSYHSVVLRLLGITGMLLERDIPMACRRALLRQVELIYKGAYASFAQSGDQDILREHYRQITRPIRQADRESAPPPAQ